MKILNLYAGIGGNRKLWKNCNVTAVELDPQIAACYQKHFPDDEVIVADAHQFLLENYKDFNFIWSSPPCQTHSVINFLYKNCRPPRYADMKLYQEIIFLQQFFKGDWVVENVVPYYKPLIEPMAEIERHLFWSNKFFFGNNFQSNNKIRRDRKNNEDSAAALGFDAAEIQVKDKRQVLRNCVLPELGLYVFENIVGGLLKRNFG